eukprot:2401686-Karenia_brevis.AAC.1
MPFPLRRRLDPEVRQLIVLAARGEAGFVRGGAFEFEREALRSEQQSWEILLELRSGRGHRAEHDALARARRQGLGRQVEAVGPVGRVGSQELARE